MSAVQREAPISGNVYLKQGKRQAVWYLRARVPREIRRRLGPTWTGKGRPPNGHYTRKTAQAELDNVLADARRGTLPDSTARRTGTTFADASAEWLRWVTDERKRKPSTVADYKGVVSFALDPEFGTLPLEEVTTELIDGYRARLVKEGAISDRTINKRLVVLHGILRRAMRVFGLRENAAALVDRQPLRDSGDFSVLSPTEVEAVARAAETDQDAAFYRVASFTGLRLGELRALRWMDVDFAHRVVHVKRSYTHGEIGTPKSGRVRSVPLIDQAAKALDGLSKRGAYTEPDDLVFVEDELGGYVDDRGLRLRFGAGLDRAGVKRLRLHDLRHTFGTIAVRAFPLSDVKAYMGHADVQTTMRYVHFVPQDDAADKLTRVVADAELPYGQAMTPLPTSTGFSQG